MNVTIKDVAKLAGVSVATVSRVLNSSANVSDDTAEAVNNAIEALGYSPNFLGRNLRKCETNVILAIIPSTEHTFYSEILHGMQNQASDLGYDLLMSTSNSDLDTELRLLNMIANRTMDAAVLLGTRLSIEQLEELDKKHCIALCCERMDGTEVLSVSVDDEAAAYDAVSYLIEKGHTKIAMISTDVRVPSSVARENGYMRALKDNSIEFKDEYMYRGGYDFSNGRIALRNFTKLDDKPTAIFAISDMLALGILKEAALLGITVGEDIAVMGFDNVSISQMSHPGISTVEQPCYEMGRLLIRKVVENIGKKGMNKGRINVPHKLIIRESTGEQC